MAYDVSPTSERWEEIVNIQDENKQGRELRQYVYELENKVSSYEYELRKQKLELLLLECDKFVEKVNKHNQRINKDYSSEQVTMDDKLFLFDIIEINFYRLLLAIRKNNLYDPLINVFIDLIDGLKTLRSSFKDVYENIIKSQKQKEDKLRVTLDAYVPEIKKKTPKEELSANVLTSLNRYFVNFTNELDNFIKIVFDFYMNLINKLTISYDEMKQVVEHFNQTDITSENLFDGME